jgi:recombination protein RecA
MAVELEVVEKRGSYYYRDGESLAQGRENAKQFLREHPDIADQVETAVREGLGLEGTPLPTADEEDPGEDETLEVEEPQSAAEPVVVD